MAARSLAERAVRINAVSFVEFVKGDPLVTKRLRFVADIAMLDEIASLERAPMCIEGIVLCAAQLVCVVFCLYAGVTVSVLPEGFMMPCAILNATFLFFLLRCVYPMD